MRVEGRPGASFSAGKASRFFSGSSDTRWYQGQGGRSFDLSPDGQRVIVVKDRNGADSPCPTSIRIFVNGSKRERVGKEQ
jgi:hypothetical protein